VIVQDIGFELSSGPLVSTCIEDLLVELRLVHMQSTCVHKTKFARFNTVISDGFKVRTVTLQSSFVFSSSQNSTTRFVSLKFCLSILDFLYLSEDEILKDLPTELSGASILVNYRFVMLIASNF